ncbi:hypothetical protein LVJ94_26830 [Pendulispora rubella]|uniref:Uncharacterized protein n=1 Tax=Pendulispora rubella TaxID=2741070 RepID=A0ABZ2KU66_9BACT
MIRKGLVASLLGSIAAIGLWVACLPSEPEIIASTPSQDEAGAPDAGMCDPNAPFTNRGRVFAAPLGQDRRGATLTNDEKTIYFGFTASGFLGRQYPAKLYVPDRNGPDEKFDGGRPMEGALNGLAGQDYPRFNHDGRIIVFAGHLDGGAPDGSPEGPNNPYLYFATKGDAGTFGTPQRLKLPLNTGSVTFNPFLRTLPGGGGDLWFSQCTEPGGCFGDGGTLAIYRADVLHDRFEATNAFSIPVRVEGGVDLPNTNEYSPVVSADGNELLYSSAAAIYSTYQTTPGQWTKPRSIPLGGVYRDAPAWISPDHCRLYYESQVENENGSPSIVDIYLATRPAPGH